MQTCVNVFIDAQIHTYITTSPAHLACPSGEVDSALQLCSLSSAWHEFPTLYCMFNILHRQFSQICSQSWTASLSYHTWLFLQFMENLSLALTESWIWVWRLRCSTDFFSDKTKEKSIMKIFKCYYQSMMSWLMLWKPSCMEVSNEPPAVSTIINISRTTGTEINLLLAKRIRLQLLLENLLNLWKRTDSPGLLFWKWNYNILI